MISTNIGEGRRHRPMMFASTILSAVVGLLLAG